MPGLKFKNYKSKVGKLPKKSYCCGVGNLTEVFFHVEMGIRFFFRLGLEICLFLYG